MSATRPSLDGFGRTFGKATVVAALALMASAGSASAVILDSGVVIQFEIELLSLTLSGGPFALPLARDPANRLGDSVDGFGFVDSHVLVTRSLGVAALGRAFAFPASSSPPPIGSGAPPIDPNALDGEQFLVDSFFDVFFDITLTDVDSRPGRDYPGLPDGSVFTLALGPASMRSSALLVFDKDAPNFGLIPPPEDAPYVGHFLIEVPLGVDINGNSEFDKIKFTLGVHAVGNENRTFAILPDGTVIDQFNSAAFLEGAVVDESTDPPFAIGTIGPTGLPNRSAFGGPTTASSRLVNQIQVGEPASVALLGMGLAALALLGRRWTR